MVLDCPGQKIKNYFDVFFQTGILRNGQGPFGRISEGQKF